MPPFNKCSLAAVNQNENPNALRVLTLLFDTHDKPKLKNNFNETLKLTKLTDIFTPSSINELSTVYPSYLEKVATGYIQAGKSKEFPYSLNIR